MRSQTGSDGEVCAEALEDKMRAEFGPSLQESHWVRRIQTCSDGEVCAEELEGKNRLQFDFSLGRFAFGEVHSDRLRRGGLCGGSRGRNSPGFVLALRDCHLVPRTQAGSDGEVRAEGLDGKPRPDFALSLWDFE